MAILLIFWINLTKLEGSAQGKIAHVLNSPGSQDAPSEEASAPSGIPNECLEKVVIPGEVECEFLPGFP